MDNHAAFVLVRQEVSSSFLFRLNLIADRAVSAEVVRAWAATKAVEISIERIGEVRGLNYGPLDRCFLSNGPQIGLETLESVLSGQISNENVLSWSPQAGRCGPLDDGLASLGLPLFVRLLEQVSVELTQK